jgi:hypothetical protein
MRRESLPRAPTARSTAPRVLTAGVLCLTLIGATGRSDPPGPGGRPAQRPWSDLTAIVHVHTSLVDGQSSPLEFARAARAAGIGALLVTDHYLARAYYGPWPLGDLLGIWRDGPSVMTIGVDRYLRELAGAEHAVPGIVVVPGLEVTPYARWEGSLLAHTLVLKGWHRHMLIFGLEDPAILARLPAFGNRRGGDLDCWSLLFALPALAVAWSARRLLFTAPGPAGARASGGRSPRRRILEAATGLASLALLYAGYPYRSEAFGPTGPDPGRAPFDRLIDRVRRKGGITIWAHPEAAASMTGAAGVRMVTDSYPELVGATSADGFSVLPEGARRLLPAGGIWDRLLLGCLAQSPPAPMPVALAELDEHRAVSAIDFGELQTILMVSARSRDGVLEALRAGRLYGRWTPRGQPPLRLVDFSVDDGGTTGISGETIVARGPVTIHLAVDGGNGSPVTARLVSGGRVFWSLRAVPPLEARVEGSASLPAYYRLDVEGAYPYRLTGNPVAVLAPQEGA